MHRCQDDVVHGNIIIIVKKHHMDIDYDKMKKVYANYRLWKVVGGSYSCESNLNIPQVIVRDFFII